MDGAVEGVHAKSFIEVGPGQSQVPGRHCVAQNILPKEA